ncbi:attacin-B-like [Agrilus planipennis]|uniref:Attacin-B-like n=1 Tax=Agrilus planipennis TaxID=224129 RepID=A0A7F5REY5_AGRPL|nr:attacin-B-like [Agrilus planipennis]XP_025834546.1 attacin-B-like [Agrilus planipennis]
MSLKTITSLLLVVFVFGFVSSYPTSDTYDEDYHPQEQELYEVMDLDEYHPRERREAFEDVQEEEDEDDNIEEVIYEQPLVRERRQLFGGKDGRHQQIGYKAGPAWGSLSHSGGPITYSGGLGVNSPAGHGLSGSLSHTPGIGGQGSVRGTVGLVNTPNHQLSGWAQHDRNFDRHMRRFGPETNSAGLNYQHGSGANAFLSGSKTPGFPSTGSVGGSIPLNRDLSVSGQTNFGQGMKPDHQVGLTYQKTF